MFTRLTGVLVLTFAVTACGLDGDPPRLTPPTTTTGDTSTTAPATTTTEPIILRPVPAKIWSDERREPLDDDWVRITGVFHHCPEWEEAAVRAGWDLTDLYTLDHLMWRESRCDPMAHNRDDPTRWGSRGLLQINGFWINHFDLDPELMFDPDYNLAAGLRVWEHSGFGPWGYPNYKIVT